jgi:hypothetical protein
MGAWDEFDLPENDGPDYWKPEDPEKIRGKVLEIGVHVDDEGKRFPQLTLDIDGAEVVVTGFRKILRDELVKLVKEDGAGVGDEVEIDFQGKPAGKRYFVYRAKKLSAAPKRAAKKDNEDF